ncbi:MAG: hypothetical protein IJH57_05580 [Mogibacterium sp.]|nr:hypothetical protein [Mogibacterium sp.]
MPIMEKEFRLKTADNNEEYEGLRTLWCEVFSDVPSFVDAMYANFGEDITGYVAIDEEGQVGSALTCFKCGSFEGRDVYTSYAICTAEDKRGLGLAGKLVETARDDVLAKGGISLISPAEPSLEKFYGAHGYVPFFFADKKVTEDDDEDFIFDSEDDEYEKIEAKTVLKPLRWDEYNEYRESFLEGTPHVKLNEHMMRLVQAEAAMPDGESGLLLVNGGDAICAMNAGEDGALEIEELLVNPMLSSISSEIADEMACRIAAHFERDTLKYRVPGSAHCQSMAAGLTDEMMDKIKEGEPAYYGFPVE